MKGTAKLSIEAYAVVDGTNDRVQYTINIKVKSRVVSTLTTMEENWHDQSDTVAHWLLSKVLNEMDSQRAWHFTDETWPIQEELPF